MSLMSQEAFSWLCAGDADTAQRSLDRFPHEIILSEKSPNVWLQAFIALKRGDLKTTQEVLAIYLGRPLRPDEHIDEAFFVDLWAESSGRQMGSSPAFYFPNLPPSLTGLPTTLNRLQYQRPIVQEERSSEAVAREPASAAVEPVQAGGVSVTSGAKAVLAVATEWSSRHGGLSTFNRELCLAMARAAHRVVCLVPQATSDEIGEAQRGGVRLVVASPVPGLDEQALLCLRPPLPDDFVPEIVIGHDRVTGPAAQALAEEHFPEAARIQFIHTAPGEIEWFKDKPAGKSIAAKAEERERLQLNLAKTADLVLAVGPRLYREFATVLAGLASPPPIRQLNPGLPRWTEQDAATARRPAPQFQCLLLGRAEDDKLKGLDIAARAFGLLSQSSAGSNKPVLVIRGAQQGTGEQLRDDLRALAAPASIEVRVKEYTTQTERLMEDLRRASLLIMPSRKEGFGLVGIEAIAAGTPVLLSDQSGLGELIRKALPEEADRFVVPISDVEEKDAEAWSRRIEFILMDPESAFKRAEKLRERLATILSWENAVAQVFEGVTND